MPDPNRKIQLGDKWPFSATAYNSMIDAARAERARQFDRRFGALTSSRDGSIVKVKNQTGANLNRHSVLGLDAPIFPPSASLDAFLRAVTFRGVVPAAGNEGKFCVLLEPAVPGQVVWAAVAGTCQVRINVVDTEHTCAEVVSGDIGALVSSDDGSAQIIWREGEDAYSTGEQWAIVRFGSTCGGSKKGSTAGGRCDCPDDPYEIEVDCGDCGAYYGGGTVMPRFWWLSITIASTPYGEPYGYCEALSCEELNALRIKLTNETTGYGGYGAYGDASCTWSAKGAKCVHAELTLEGENWKITLMDQNDCVLAVLRKSIHGFACCGDNDGWTLDSNSKCDVTVRLTPHECTCCPDKTCPPPDTQTVCEDTDCCVENCNCNLTVTVANLATQPPIPCTQFDPECYTIDHNPCPFPVGDPGRLGCYKNFATPQQSCGGMNGAYGFVWEKNCTWKFRGTPAGSGSVEVAAKLTLSGRLWRLELLGPDGQTAFFETVNWNCTHLVEFVYKGGTCPVVGSAPVASFNLCLNVT